MFVIQRLQASVTVAFVCIGCVMNSISSSIIFYTIEIFKVWGGGGKTSWNFWNLIWKRSNTLRHKPITSAATLIKHTATILQSVCQTFQSEKNNKCPEMVSFLSVFFTKQAATSNTDWDIVPNFTVFCNINNIPRNLIIGGHQTYSNSQYFEKYWG